MYSPVQRDRNGSKPCTQHRTNQPAVYLINGHQKSDNLPPCLAIHTVDVYQGKRAKQRNMSAAKERVQVVRGDRRAEKHKSGSEEGR
jgi:hypothetical protein